jgi:uncharacterized protein YbcI
MTTFERHARLYGHEPRTVHVHLSHGYLVAVMEGTLTGPERTVVSAGSAEAVERTRVEVQCETTHEVHDAVELLTGRRVLPQVDAKADISPTGTIRRRRR